MIRFICINLTNTSLRMRLRIHPRLYTSYFKKKKKKREGEGRRKARNETFPRGESPKLNSFITILALIAGKGKKK